MATSALPTAPRLPAHLESRSLEALSEADSLSEILLGGSLVGQTAAHVEIMQCRILNVDFTSCELADLRLTDDVVEHSDFCGAYLEEATLNRVLFGDCKMSGLEIARSSMRDVVFSQCRLDNANLRMCELERVTFDTVDLRTADFYGTSLVDCRFYDCNLTGVDFSKAQADGTRLHGSVLDDIKGVEALRGVVIDSNQVVPLGVRLLETMGIGVDDDREPEPTSRAPKRSQRPGR